MENKTTEILFQGLHDNEKFTYRQFPSIRYMVASTTVFTLLILMLTLTLILVIPVLY